MVSGISVTRPSSDLSIRQPSYQRFISWPEQARFVRSPSSRSVSCEPTGSAISSGQTTPATTPSPQAESSRKWKCSFSLFNIFLIILIFHYVVMNYELCSLMAFFNLSSMMDFLKLKKYILVSIKIKWYLLDCFFDFFYCCFKVQSSKTCGVVEWLQFIFQLNSFCSCFHFSRLLYIIDLMCFNQPALMHWWFL